MTPTTVYSAYKVDWISAQVPRKMAGIEVYRENIRDLDNPNEDDLRAARQCMENMLMRPTKNTQNNSTEVPSQLAKASEEERKQAMDLPLGATSCIQSVGSDYRVSVCCS